MYAHACPLCFGAFCANLKFLLFSKQYWRVEESQTASSVYDAGERHATKHILVLMQRSRVWTQPSVFDKYSFPTDAFVTASAACPDINELAIA